MREEQPLFKHVANCAHFLYILDLNQLPENFGRLVNVTLKEHLFNAVQGSVKIFDLDEKWSAMRFLKAYYIKTFKPTINDSLKASRDFELF